jgi:hypothetical protein
MRSVPVRAASLLLCWPALALTGCAPQHADHLPAYIWTNNQAALRELSRHAHAVKTMSAAALLTLTRPDGQSIRLDGAVVISLADRKVRLRAWKLGQAVFDLTLTREALWIEIPKDSAHRRQIGPASISASQFARGLSIFDGDEFDGLAVRLIDQGGPTLEVRKLLEDGQTISVEVEHSTLIVRQYRLSDARGAVHFTLTPTDYRPFNGILWPTRLKAKSDSGAIDAELRDVEINGDLPPSAFVPPRGAEKAS